MADLTFAQDFTSSIDLDSSLISVPDSGLYWNRGVHPTVTIKNLLEHLPILDFTFSDWNSGVNYEVFATTKSINDIVTYDGKVYESIKASNNLQPDVNSEYWLLTNIESLRLKSFIWSVDDNFRSALKLSRRLIENQYIYNVDSRAELTTLSGDFSGWAFEPKNSDYVKIKINQIAFQANTSTQQSLYVINQGQLIDTLTLNPQNGRLVFEDINYTISGKGVFYFVFENVEVLSRSVYHDALRYDGFVCYPVTGIGTVAKDITYSQSSSANGLNFNVSCYLDSDTYIDNNSVHLAKFKQSQFELDAIEMFVYNSNSRSNRSERIIGNSMQLLTAESKDLKMKTVAKKYQSELKDAKDAINNTFDRFLKAKPKFRIKRGVI